MNRTSLVISALVLVSISGLGYYYFQSESSINSIETGLDNTIGSDASFILEEESRESMPESGDLSEPLKLDLKKIQENVERTNRLRKELALRQKELNKSLAALKSDLSQPSLAANLEADFVNPNDLPKPLELDAFVSGGQADFQRDQLSAASAANGLVTSVPIPIKQNLQRDTGVSPADVDAAFNVQNTE